MDSGIEEIDDDDDCGLMNMPILFFKESTTRIHCGFKSARNANEIIIIIAWRVGTHRTQNRYGKINEKNPRRKDEA